MVDGINAPLTGIVKVAAGADSSVAIDGQGKVWHWGYWNNNYHSAATPVNMGNNKAVDVAVTRVDGVTHVNALMENGVVVTNADDSTIVDIGGSRGKK